MFRRKITLKLFLITTLSLVLLVGIVVFVQLFIVSRMYLTTEYTKQRESDLSKVCIDIAKQNTSVLTNTTDSNIVTNLLDTYADANSACFLVLDKNAAVKYMSTNTKKELTGNYIKSIGQTISGGKGYSNTGLNFRVTGILGIPSKYIAVYTPVDYSNKNAGFVMAVTKEVYTDQNYDVLLKYMLYLFLFSILLAVALAAVFSYIVTRPVLKIRDAAARMTNMNFKQKCDYKANDEIGDLSESVNFLSGKLDATLKELNMANAKLQKDLDIQKEIDLMRKDFIAAVSHEFKTPLTLIKGYTEGIKDNVVREEEIKQAQDIIVTEVDKMDKLVADLLDLSKLESSDYKLHSEEFIMDELLQTVAIKYGLIMQGRRIAFEYNLNCECTRVTADKFRMEQVVTNFLNNALSNTPENGKIALKSELKDNSVKVSVMNTGGNISDDELNKIWEKFYRTDKSRNKKTGGTGLGLTISKAILEKHNSTFGTQNIENGVQFYFTLKII